MGGRGTEGFRLLAGPKGISSTIIVTYCDGSDYGGGRTSHYSIGIPICLPPHLLVLFCPFSRTQSLSAITSFFDGVSARELIDELRMGTFVYEPLAICHWVYLSIDSLNFEGQLTGANVSTVIVLLKSAQHMLHMHGRFLTPGYSREVRDLGTMSSEWLHGFTVPATCIRLTGTFNRSTNYKYCTVFFRAVTTSSMPSKDLESAAHPDPGMLCSLSCRISLG
jgi:hypothetical protein